MPTQILFYISAATDLETEREVLGRAVAEVPVDLAWRVVQSPGGNGPVDFDAVANAGVHILVMGGDIRAPVGLEWQLARQAGRQPVALLKQDVTRTPAGQQFVRLVRDSQRWVAFAGAADLRRKVLILLADHILHHAVHYVLTPEELTRLTAWREELATHTAAVDEETRGGAGDSSILLSRDRFEPSGGVLLGGGRKREE
jgi:hypothetical protein